MSEWKFRDYQRPVANGHEVLVNEILEWTRAQPKKAQAKIDAIVLSLQGFPVWPAQYVSALKGCPDILELRIKSGGVQYRPLGCYGPGAREFTLLVGTIEKGGAIPKGDCDKAVTRRKRVLSEGWPTCEHEFA